ncbi:MAG: hypothetical protein ACREFE_02345 [Limisphaerales bacterium]
MNQICHKLHLLFSGLPKFEFDFDINRIPRNGIYVLFENGEFAHEKDRIVRVGTHTGNNQLPSRLKQHFIKENKDRSIFRKNIGRAILNRDLNRDFLAQWEIDLTTRDARQKYAGVIDKQKLLETEKRVSEYIRRNFYFVTFRVDDKSKRLYWESKIISTISQCDECRPSQNWLGLHSPKEKIRSGRLWLVNELNKQILSENDYEALKMAVLSKT